MPISLNASFTGAAPADVEFQHPEGASIARLVHQSVQQRGWVAEEIDNWRDSGWNFICSLGSARLEFVISGAGRDEWMLQIAPASIPGLVGRLFGNGSSASPNDVFELSVVVHRILGESGSYHEFRWQWDGPPTPRSDQEPVPWA